MNEILDLIAKSFMGAIGLSLLILALGFFFFPVGFLIHLATIGKISMLGFFVLLPVALGITIAGSVGCCLAGRYIIQGALD